MAGKEKQKKKTQTIHERNFAKIRAKKENNEKDRQMKYCKEFRHQLVKKKRSINMN